MMIKSLSKVKVKSIIFNQLIKSIVYAASLHNNRNQVTDLERAVLSAQRSRDPPNTSKCKDLLSS